MRGWTSKVFLFRITLLGRWRRLCSILSCKVCSMIMTYRPVLISEFNPTSSRFFACKINLGLWLHFCIKCHFRWWFFPREWGWGTWTRSGVWFHRFIRMWWMLLEFSQYILLYEVYINCWRKCNIYIIQRTSTSWYNSVAFWWKPETSSSVFLGSFDLDGAFLVSLLWAQV